MDEKKTNLSGQEANDRALESLAAGNLDACRIFLDHAEDCIERMRQASAQHEHFSSYENSPRTPRNAQSPRELEDADDTTRELAELVITTQNTVASWWRARKDLGKALEVLTRALTEAENVTLPPRLRALTHSNLCSVLSQVHLLL